MTYYPTSNQSQSAISAAAKAAKAKRQAVLQRVQAQRAAAAKRSVAELMRSGEFIRGNVLKERYLRFYVAPASHIRHSADGLR